MYVIKTYVENLFKDLPRSKELKMAQSDLSQMMTHRYNELIAQGSTHNEAMSEVILTYGDLGTVAPELGIAEVLQKQSEPLSKEEADSFLMQMKQFGRTATSSAVIVLWAVSQILLLSSLYFELENSIRNNAIIYFLISFFFPVLTALVLYLRSYLNVTNKLRLINSKVLGLENRIALKEQALNKQNKNKKRRIIGTTLLIIAIIASFTVQIKMFIQREYCAFRGDWYCTYSFNLYHYGAMPAFISITSLFLMIIGIVFIIPSYIDDFAYRRLMGEEFEGKFKSIMTFSWIFWLVVSLLFIFVPSPFARYSYIIDYWPWAMALYMLILFIWNLFSRRSN